MRSTGANLGQALDQAAYSDLYGREELRRRQERQKAVPSPVVVAFTQFERAASRRAALASAYAVAEHDFTMLIETLAEHLDQLSGSAEVLDEADVRALIAACTTYASAFSTGAHREADAPFAASLATVRDRVAERLSRSVGDAS